jgi:ABC-type glycerol-3-phosphate transport system substrate-binding protein
MGQIDTFHQWQIKHGHGTQYTLATMAELKAFRAKNWSPELISAMRRANADGETVWDPATTAADLPLTIRVPACEMRLDAASNELRKKLVQGISGVAGDVIEAYSGGQQMQFLAAAGMLADVTDSARQLGFGPEKTYPALAPALFVDGRQYAFPRNPAQTMYWVNKETFARYGQEPPPSRWTVEQYEARGKALVAAANPSGKRRRVFFANRLPRTELFRSMGLSVFNETLTRCALDDPRYVRVLALEWKWTYADRLLPSQADRSSFTSEGGWGSIDFQLFKSGQFGMVASGRWALMQFRKFGEMQLAVVEPPHGGMPNTLLSGGQSTVYRASRHRRCAELFLAYMASEEYNMQIVRDGDGLPPNPKYAETELFLRPPARRNEWGCHAAYHNAAKYIAIVQSFSPFILPVVAFRYEAMAREEVMSDQATPEEAAARCVRRMHDEMQRNLNEDAALQKRFDEWSALQKRIEQRRAENKGVPIEWIKNPFHRTWYRGQGWLEEAGD